MITLESIKSDDGRSNMSLFWGFQVMNLKAYRKESSSFKNFEKLDFLKDIMTVEPKDHLVHLNKFLENGLDLKSINSIFELGGGCGSLCRLIHELGFNKSYTILDLPVVSELQKSYLLDSNIGVLVSTRNYIDKPRDVDMFISMWALSETPFEYRKRILDKINFKHCMICFQKDFGTEGIEEYNNLKYFKNMIKEYPDYNWTLKQIKNIPNNYYLFGEAK